MLSYTLSSLLTPLRYEIDALSLIYAHRYVCYFGINITSLSCHLVWQGFNRAFVI